MTHSHLLPRDITGYTFGRLRVRKLSAKRDAQGNRLWLCDCECGGIKFASRVHLRRGQVVSCGCAQVEQRLLSLKTHREAQEEVKALRLELDATKKKLADAQREIAYLTKLQGEPKNESVGGPWTKHGANIPDPFAAVYD